MLARLQQFTTLLLLVAAVGWAWWWASRGAWWWAGLGALAIVFAYAGVLALEFVLVHHFNRHEPVGAASVGQLLRAWAHEVMTAPRVFCWRQPFRSRSIPDWIPPPPAQRSAPAEPAVRGVVLVHGFVCNRGLWNPWMPRLREAGVPYIAVDLEPVFGSVGGYADIIDAAVHRLLAATGVPPVVVGHSMGGLAVRHWVAGHDGDVPVARVVTIGTPHRGTWLGRFAFSRNGAEMREGSRWLEELCRREAARDGVGPALFVCFYSHCDNIVFPASTATLPGADNRHLPGCAHVQMAYETAVFSEVLRLAGVAPRTEADAGKASASGLRAEGTPRA